MKTKFAVFSFFLLSVVLQSAQAWSKSLYLTVRRDFAPSENAVIELNYRSQEPIHLRVLESKDKKSFIASQIDLRRAWREPRVEFNPMHFLVSGFNDSQFDTDWIRRGANVKMRKQVPDLSGGKSSEKGTSVSPGPERLITAPEAFTVVSEITITPETADIKQPFDVPGFGVYDWGSGENLQTKLAQLPKLAPGFYVVQAVQGDAEGQVVVVVNDLAAQLQQSSSQAVVRVVDRSGRAVENAGVSIRNLQGKWVREGKTSANGEWFADGIKESDLLTIVESEKRGTAIIDSEFFTTTAIFPDLYLYTDRPMYRRGNKVHFRGILRQVKDGASLPLANKGTAVTVRLVAADGTPTESRTNLKVSDYGTFSGELDADESLKEGVYRVVASVSGVEHAGELRVKDYVKPLFFVTVESQQETLRAGQELTASVKAERYAGGTPAAATANVQLYRVRVQAPQWAEDAGLGETGSTTTYGFDESSGPAADLPVLVHEIADLRLDEKATAQVNFKVPEELPGPAGFDYKFELKVAVTDADGNMSMGTKTFLDLASEVTVQARFNDVLAEAGRPLRLSVRSLSPSGQPYPNAKGTVEFLVTPYGGNQRSLERRSVETSKDGSLTLEAPTQASGELRAVVTLNDKASRAASSEATAIVAADAPAKGIVKVSEPRLVTNEPRVAPGEKIRLLALLPEGWGTGSTNEGTLYLTVAGKKIHDRRAIRLNGLGTWIEQAVEPSFGTAVTLVLSYGDSQTGWTERRATFRIFDPTKGLKIGIQSAHAIAIPGGSQSLTFRVHGSDGKSARAELSIAVVDRSVLDLQPEIRPSLLDFFYPTDRLDLMTFVSSQFQSYGYAERVARLYKPNYWFAATKSRSDALDQQDTAYWSGSVVTDAKGEARIDFKLPGNQTIWKVIVLAADAKGRFGEAQSEFKANLPVNLLLGYPQFLRRGDEARLRLNLTSTASSELPIEYRLLPSDLVLTTPLIELQATIKPGERLDRVSTMSLSPEAEPQSTSILSQLKIAGSDLAFRNGLKILTDSTDQPESLDIRAGRAKLVVQPGERVRSATLRVTSGLYGTLMPAMRWLIRYPYGCVEQTTSALIPNLVFGTLLESSKLNLRPEERKMLADAKEFGLAGWTRLKSYVGPQGAFSWFNSEREGDLDMTILVLTVLASAQDTDLANLSSFASSIEWLGAQSITEASPRGVTRTYIQSEFQRAGVVYVTEATVVPRLKLQAEYVLASGSASERAMMLIAMKRFGYKDSGLTALRDRLVAEVRNAFTNAASENAIRKATPAGWIPQADWPAYPGRMASTLALLGRALHEAATPAERPKGFTEILRARLANRFDGENFGSTFETSMTLLHSEWLIREELKNAKSTSSDAKLSLDGTAIPESALKRRQLVGGAEVEIDASVLVKGGDLAVSGAPSGAMTRLAMRKGYSLASTKPVERGWSLSRTYFKLGANGERTPFDPEKDKVKVGDLLFVQLDLAGRARSPWASRYYVMSDQVPAGFSALEEDREYAAAPWNLPLKGANYRVRELGTEVARWYFDFTRGWMDKPGTVGYVLRANYAGRFASGVARIEDFYDDEQFSQTTSRMITVDAL